MKTKSRLFFALLAVGVAAFVGVTAASAEHGRPHHEHDAAATHDAGKAVAPTSGSDSGQTSTGVCGLDRVWLQTSMQGDRFEIDGGTIALSKSTETHVRQLAQTLVHDHTQSYAEAVALARSLGIPVETEPTPSEQWQLEEIREMSGAGFNHDYSELEVADHVQDIQEAQDEVQYGCNAQVRAEAQKEIPTLQMHLSLAKAALQANANES
jgi:putative membrane protein